MTSLDAIDTSLVPIDTPDVQTGREGHGKWTSSPTMTENRTDVVEPDIGADVGDRMGERDDGLRWCTTLAGDRKLEMVESTVGLPPPSSPRSLAGCPGALMRFSSIYCAASGWGGSVMVNGSLLAMICSLGAELNRPLDRTNRSS